MKASRNQDSAQPSLFTTIRWPKATVQRRAELLSIVERTVPWDELERAVRPHYQADARKTGRRGYSLRMMLKSYVLQQLWHMSDRQAEAAILDSHELARFIGTDPWAPRPPSATVIRTFRQLLLDTPADNALDMLDDAVNTMIVEGIRSAGLEFRPGRIQDPVFRRCIPATPPATPGNPA